MNIIKYLLIRLIIINIIIISYSSCIPMTVTGTTQQVSLELTKNRSINETLQDIKISSGIKNMFLKKKLFSIYKTIKVEVFQGNVLYTGVVDNPNYIKAAIKIAWLQHGVKRVFNEIQLSNDSKNFDLKQYAKDCMITSIIKVKSMLNEDIASAHYTIITINNIVYLFGISQSKKELETIAKLAADTSEVKEVISYIKITTISDDFNKKTYDYP